jgi:integrase
MKLTQQAAARAKLPAGKAEAILWDDTVRGFGLRVRAGGKQTWICQFRIGRKQRRISFGSPAILNADAARKKAREMLGKVALGTDPQAERNEARAQAAHTLEAVAKQYLEVASTQLRPRSFTEIERYLQKSWKPLHSLPIQTISRRDIAARLGELAQTGATSANRARGALSSLYVWSMQQGLVEHNPVIGTGKLAEQSRDRVLDATEIRDIWNACGPDDFGACVKLMLLTAARRSEVGGMRFEEIAFSTRTWTIPRERSKNNREHTVWLSDPALEIIKNIPRRKSSGHLFGTVDGRPFSGWAAARAALDARLAAAQGPDQRKAPRFVLHDLRRSAATYMANDLGVPPHIVEAILNHAGSAQVARIYNRATYVAERKAALDRWGSTVLSIVAGGTDNIVALKA